MNKYLKLLFETTKKRLNNFVTTSSRIPLNKNQQNLELQKYKEIAENTIITVNESGYFKSDFLPILSEMIYSITKPGCTYTDPFNKNACLSLEEKKDLGLNSRRKYSRELINGLTTKGLKAEDPNDLLKNIWFQNFHKISRKYELNRLKELGLKYVQILNCGDERDCKSVKHCKKRWPINEVPELPLPGCNADYCRCCYIADEKELLKK